MTHGLGLMKIGNTIHPYPMQAEAIRKLGDQINRTRLMPFVKSLFRKWLSWTRCGKSKGFGTDMEKASGRDHHALPMLAVYMVDKSGKVTFAHSNPDDTKRLNFHN